MTTELTKRLMKGISNDKGMPPDEFAKLRARLALTHADLVALLQCDRSTISRYENGHTRIPTSVAIIMRLLEQLAKRHNLL